LCAYLPNAFEKLKKYGRLFFDAAAAAATALIVVVVLDVVARSMAELVAEREPLFFDEHLKSVHSAIVRIKQEARQRARLRRSIPSVRAMDHYVYCLIVHGLHYEHRRVYDRFYVLEPIRLVQVANERRLAADLGAFFFIF
jgi:hypothetical protein